ncbi:hypothetical protein DH2020_011541 [Rehmannia glutinosa]|uniref:DUF674 family protein n=1 Tax=Rehmannia glutinosa TaxID=99300 RepID=A0ABR0XDN2_REHGL
MSQAEDVKFSLKVVINKQKSKVLFAEADSDFTDVLLSFLTLPLGTIVRTLEKHYGDKAPVIGSLTTLYNGLSNLDNALFWAKCSKQMLMNPRSSSETECPKLKLNIFDETQPIKYFKCENKDCEYNKNIPTVSMYFGGLECDCGYLLSKEIGLRDKKTKRAVNDDSGGGGVFTINKAYFIISDDLQILPSLTGSIIRILSNLSITDTDGTELRNVTFGFNEIMDLLKGSLLSQTPLTDLILKRQLGTVTAKYDFEKEATSNTCTKMTLKAILQKSTNKLLFVEAKDDFIDFLFSLLAIPLGEVERLFGSSTSLKNIDNLYRSVADINGDMYLKTDDTKTMLLQPKLPFGYISEKHILPLNEEEAPDLYLCEGLLSEDEISNNPGERVSRVEFRKCMGYYVEGQRMYMVTDDLTVTPLVSCLSIFSGMNIRFSDVKELEMHIGLEEAMSILKASLTSTSAITDGLINPTLRNNQNKNSEGDEMDSCSIAGRYCPSVSIESPKGPGNYVKGPTMYMVTDGLTVTPLCTTSSLYFLNRLKIPFSDVKEMELEIGLEEALSILKASLMSTWA